MGPELLLGFAGLLALVAKVTDFFRLLSNFVTEKSAVATQTLSWIGGVVAVMLFAHSDFGASVTIGDQPLNLLNGASLVIVGLMVSSAASLAVDFKQARDSTDSAAKPKLLK